MGVGIGLIVASVLCFSVTLILAVIAYEVWDDYITDKVLAVAALSLFLLGLGLIIEGIGRIVS